MAHPAAAFHTLKLYRDCLRLAEHVGSKGGNTHAIKKQIQLQFRKNAGEADPDKIIEQKEAAVRGLSNYMFVEAQRMAQEGKGADKFDG